MVWSALDRKFSDMDLRVIAQLMAGPVDQNQFGVIFRYRDAQNFYMFRITSDGYYLLAKVENGLQDKVRIGARRTRSGRAAPPPTRSA